MATENLAPARAEFAAAGPRTAHSVLPLYVAALFLSALLLFSVQPLIARMVLPLLGGSPAVWNTAMVFFQTMLLAGYAYAHLTSRLLAPRPQAVLHLGVLALAAITLPVGLPAGWTPPAVDTPIPWLLGLLAASVGLPFFAISANAPILQRWFAHSRHASAGDPYFLYGASNLGSILALLAYPIVIEPALGLDRQSGWWTVGYAALAVLIIGCAARLGRRRGTDDGNRAVAAADRPNWALRLHWLALAAVPSALLLGLTAHISTDVAAVPLLWVVPLSLYLLTFVITFARRPLLRHGWMLRIQPFVVIMLGLFYWFKFPVTVFLPFHLATFFVCAMVCHGELARRRPDARHLTEFYLWMSVGGLVGGAFTALIAPVVFDGVWEYPLALVLACALRPLSTHRTRRAWSLDVLLPMALAGVIVLWFANRPEIPQTLAEAGGVMMLSVLAVLAMALYAFSERPLRFALGIAAVLFATVPVNEAERVLGRERSFFGVYKVKHDAGGAYRVLVHGTTVHGAQHTDPALRREMRTYYGRGGPVGQVLARLNDGNRLRRVGIVGLGVGTMACYRQPGQSWTFYEIDPMVAEIARRNFHYLADCAPEAPVVLGDARLSLARAPDEFYDLLVLDAFSSDSIPIHLLTREALALYRAKLAGNGVLLIHVSNRNLDLAPVVANLAAHNGLRAWRRFSAVSLEDRRERHLTASDWIVLARAAEDVPFLAGDDRWQALDEDPRSGVWTDNFSNIFSVIRW